jgi:hypothetical protein
LQVTGADVRAGRMFSSPDEFVILAVEYLKEVLGATGRPPVDARHSAHPSSKRLLILHDQLARWRVLEDRERIHGFGAELDVRVQQESER